MKIKDTCIDCGAEIIDFEKLKKIVYRSGNLTVTEYFCANPACGKTLRGYERIQNVD